MHPDDLPPPLAWEGAIWWLYLRVSTQVRITAMGHIVGLDYNPAIALIRDLRWNLPRALYLLQAIERQLLGGESETESETEGDSGD